MAERNYDLVVIGSGPAGEKGAAQAAYFGKSVALVEREPILGGAAANTGTLPSKTLRETALMLSGFRAREVYGVDLSLRREATVKDFVYRERTVKALERERIARNIDRHGVDLYHGAGAFADAHTIEVCGPDGPPARLRGEKILIATGSAPRRPELFAFEDRRIWDSDQVLNLDFMPHSMAVVGAGVIGSEYACTFAALGAEVSLVDGRANLLDFLDREISGRLRETMERKLGIRIVAPARVTACDPSGKTVKLALDGGEVLDVEAVLVAAGRQSNTAGLKLENAGIQPGPRGLIHVNACFQTQIPHIYAAGDVIGFPALASTSMEQARLAMVHAFDLKYKTVFTPILPFGIFTIPEVSMAGQTEQALEERGIPVVIGRASYGQNPRGVIVGDFDGLLKLIFHRESMKLLGVHVVGESATEVVHVGMLALLADATYEIFIRACFNYPTLGDLYKYATYDAMGKRDRGAGSA
ncbi:MAG: Si-specific NAD(P)(+) transhydrogenase [Planctomycetota bacterium]|nr:Si-specific NAD(P)(+) transhydrogenase [Planctomycetota bacterium]